MTTSEKQSKREEQREKINEAIEALRSDAGWKRWIQTRKAINRFSFYNRLLIAVQKPDATEVYTYKRWQKEGRQVRKDEKSIIILAPIFVKVEDPDHHGRMIQKLIGFRTLREFDVSQTDGPELPERPVPDPITGDSHAWVLPELVKLAKDQGYTVEFDAPMTNGDKGYCDRVNHKIAIGSGPVNEQVTILIHEIAHTYGVDYQKYSREDAEVIVQTATWMVTEGLGLDTSSFTTDYLTGWSRPNETSALKDFAKVIDKIANTIEDAIKKDEDDK